jgi:Cytosine deaminase and related metal-dependent hydrolases
VTIVSPERKVSVGAGYVVREGEQIAAVGRATPARHGGIRWSPVRGRVLIPGSVDVHTHLAMPAGLPVPREGGSARRTDGAAFLYM